MSGCHVPYCYYGSLDKKKPIRSLSEDLLTEHKNLMMEEMKTMEERIKRHITECKREVIKELQSNKKEFINKLEQKEKSNA